MVKDVKYHFLQVCKRPNNQIGRIINIKKNNIDIKSEYFKYMIMIPQINS